MYRDLDVPLIEQPQDNYCGPASGAMILEFWHDNGYPSMKGIDYYEGATAFVNHLAVDMDTGWYGTMAPEWAAGVEEHANVHAPYFFDTTEDDSPVFSEYVHSIDYGEPVGVMWDPFSSHPDLEWHWTVGRGYSTDEYQNLMKLNDPWDVTTLWLDFDEYVRDMDIVYVEP